MESLILASTSPTRLRLLVGAGVHVQVEDPRVDENITTPDGPEGLAAALARRKARAVALHHPGAWVLGADQVVHQDGEVFGKPRSRDDHLARLKSMRGHTHALITAWTCHCLGPPGPLASTVQRLASSSQAIRSTSVSKTRWSRRSKLSAIQLK